MYSGSPTHRTFLPSGNVPIAHKQQSVSWPEITGAHRTPLVSVHDITDTGNAWELPCVRGRGGGWGCGGCRVCGIQLTEFERCLNARTCNSSSNTVLTSSSVRSEGLRAHVHVCVCWIRYEPGPETKVSVSQQLRKKIWYLEAGLSYPNTLEVHVGSVSLTYHIWM